MPPIATVNVGVTGASGVIYARRLLEQLLVHQHRVNLTVTKAGLRVLREEIDFPWEQGDSFPALEEKFRSWLGLPENNDRLRLFDIEDTGATIASGSVKVDAMVVIPCTMHTLSSIAHGTSSNLLERAADVTLKEGRTLVLVPRETPFNRIHLENMVKAADAGAKIVPPMPAFYNRPQTIDDLVNHLVGRVMDVLGLEHSLYRPWSY